MPANARTMPDSSLAALEACVDEFGYVEPIVWNERTGHIIGGHQRHGVLKDKGAVRATVVVVDLPEEEEAEANLTLNNPKIEGRWDDTTTALLEKVEEADESLFGALSMDKLRESLEKRVENPPDPGLDADDFDTSCPCCGYKWNIEANDVSVEVG
jgi:ParB-like chromosome segregation protein Spo0J